MPMMRLPRDAAVAAYVIAALAQPALAVDRHHQTDAALAPRAALAALIAQHAGANGLPVALVHRVIQRESGYNARLIDRGNYGLMQIRLGTARSLGYRGAAEGLLDPATNMTYAVRYLAGAYRAAGGNERRTLVLYSRGY